MKEHQDQGRNPGMHWEAGTLGQGGDYTAPRCGASGWGGSWDAGNVDEGLLSWKSTRHQPTCSPSVAKAADDGTAGAGHRAGLWCQRPSEDHVVPSSRCEVPKRAANTKYTDLTAFSCPSCPVSPLMREAVLPLCPLVHGALATPGLGLPRRTWRMEGVLGGLFVASNESKV